MNFFKHSTMEPFITMWKFMEEHKSNVMVASNTDGIEKVIKFSFS